MVARMRAGRLATVAVAATVTAAVVAPPPAWAQEPVVLTVGHVDALDVRYQDGALRLMLKDDTGSSPVVRDPADVVLRALPDSAIQVPADPRYGFLGEPGATIWVLPQAQDPALLWPGWSTEQLPRGTFAGEQVTLTLVDAEGPGEVSVFTVDAFGNPVVRWRAAEGTVDPATITVPIPTHAHANWAFSAEGTYTLTFQADATLAAGGTVSTGPVAYTFLVGEPDGDPGTPQVELTVTGMAPSYRPGETVSLTAVQSPSTDLDHYHWFSRCPGAAEWAVVPGEAAASYAFTATRELDGCEYQARLYDDDHHAVAASPAVTLTVTDPGQPDLSQLIIVSIDETQGALVVSVDPDDRTVVLPPAELSPSGDRLQTSGGLRPVTVTDTRAGAPGWNVSGQVGEFTGEAGAFAGSYLGWAPEVLSQASAQGVTPGAGVPSGWESGDGLATSRVLGSAPAGKGSGTARLGAGLVLQLPTQTPAGEYTATLTLTAI